MHDLWFIPPLELPSSAPELAPDGTLIVDDVVRARTQKLKGLIEAQSTAWSKQGRKVRALHEPLATVLYSFTETPLPQSSQVTFESFSLDFFRTFTALDEVTTADEQKVHLALASIAQRLTALGLPVQAVPLESLKNPHEYLGKRLPRHAEVPTLDEMMDTSAKDLKMSQGPAPPPVN